MIVSGFAATHATKDEQVEEMHPAQNDQDHPDFDRECFNSFLCVVDYVAKFQGQGHIAEVNEVKADDQQMIHGIRECLVAVKDVHEKDSAVFVECPGDPDGQGDTDRQIDEVGVCGCHDQPPFS